MLTVDPLGLHDSLVYAQLDKLDPTDASRALRDIRAATDRLQELYAAYLRGVSIAPGARKPIAEQHRAEAGRRSKLGDPTAPVWEAWADSCALADVVSELEDVLDGPPASVKPAVE